MTSLILEKGEEPRRRSRNNVVELAENLGWRQRTLICADARLGLDADDGTFFGALCLALDDFPLA